MLQELYNSSKFEEIINYFSNREPQTKDDYLTLALSYYNLNKKNKAIGILNNMLKKYPDNPDALFNLTIIYYQMKNWNKVKEFGEKYFNLDQTSWEINDILSDLYVFEGNFEKTLKHIELALKSVPDELLNELKAKFQLLKEKMQNSVMRKKLAFVCAAGLDNFINDIIEGLSDDYWVRKFAVRTDKEIYEAIEWADIVWLEWANEVAIIGSNYPGIIEKTAIVRLHSYEALSDLPYKINWNNIDKIIFVAPHIKEIFTNYFPGILDKVESEIIYNGVDFEKIQFKERQPGYNIAWVAHINYKKNPSMIIQIIKKLVDIDPRYKLHIAGDFQDRRYEIYLKYMVKEMNLENNVIFYGWIDNMDEWWEDKNYLLSTSIHEGHPYNIMEAMVRGIKPIIHNFYGAKELFPEECLFNTVDESIKIITEGLFSSRDYLEFIKERYSFKNQIDKIRTVLNSMSNKTHCIFFRGPIDGRRGGPSGYIHNLLVGLNSIKVHGIKVCSSKYLRKAYSIHFHSVLDMFEYIETFTNINKEKPLLLLTSHTAETWHIEAFNLRYFEKIRIGDKLYDINKEPETFFEALKYIEIKVFQKADYLIFPSKNSVESYYEVASDLAKIIDEKLKAGRVKFIWSGVEQLSYKIEPDEFRKRHNLENKFVISYIGRHIFVKGYDLLQEAAKKLWNLGYDFYFVIAGREYPLKGLEDPRWIEIGWTDDPGSIIKASDVFVLPNRKNYFDLALLEALSIGKIVIVSKNGGSKDIIQLTPGVISFENENVDDLCNKILEVYNLDRNERSHLGKNNKDVYRKYFTAEKMAERYINLIKEIYEENSLKWG